jgi:hypothetical protein
MRGLMCYFRGFFLKLSHFSTIDRVKGENKSIEISVIFLAIRHDKTFINVIHKSFL